MKNSIFLFVCKQLTSVCILLIVASLFIRFASCEETTEPVNEQRTNTGREGKLTLLEEQKIYLTTPKNTFLHYCAPCHGENADGKGIYFTIDLEPKPTNLTDVEYMAKLTDDYLFNFITQGSAAMQKSDLCPPWGSTLEEERIKGIISYMRALTIAKSGDDKVSDSEDKIGTMTASEAGRADAPPVIKWSVLIGLCLFFMIGARKEWKKLKIEKGTSKK